MSALYEIGCTATLRRVSERDDGRFDLVTVGADRFRLTTLDDSKPYLQGEVEFLPENTGDETATGVAVQAAQRAFRGYIDALNARGATQVSTPELPDDPLALSYLLAASIIADLHDRQALLTEPDALRRLTAERTLLSRETSMLRSLTSTPALGFQARPVQPELASAALASRADRSPSAASMYVWAASPHLSSPLVHPWAVAAGQVRARVRTYRTSGTLLPSGRVQGIWVPSQCQPWDS